MERDYVLGTHSEELERLGLQHRVWRPMVLDCWRRAGIMIGDRVLDVGAGPGYATVDLAEIVGPTGQVIAIERSENFVRAMQERCRTHQLSNVTIHSLDLMTDKLPEMQCNFSWCRWVTSFVSDPAVLVEKVARAVKKGGSAIFHEYGRYDTWQFMPPRPNQELFRRQVIETWLESGGKPDAAPLLCSLLPEHGFVLRSVEPLVYCVRPGDYMWQWQAQFVEVYLPRLEEMNRIDPILAGKVRDEFKELGANPESIMLTPLVLEIIAEKK